MEDKTREQFENSVRRGIEAQHFLQFIDREPYFKSMFVELDTEYVNAMLGLNPREREIIIARRLYDPPATLEDLSKQHNVSRERIRQIEVRAFEKLQVNIRRAAEKEGLLPPV